ncbi:GAF domain-containing protein [Roseomonas sp. SSH11]|uniref:histidine kinase n=1 Tax=Pararoseomonas baculiformis TaxID=2820812 RepID=A0ABS4A8N8_9PROT|nr:GAF domain-containing protein [Pararoseomonas baculiformis]MBP0443361.1 GAF domain-containing protein [Pararoseomonas baculiformis]
MLPDPKSGAGRGDPIRDPERLEALRRTGLLDTPPEEVFDRLTRLVCRLLGVPVALVSLVEAERQFFKSAVGLPEVWAIRRETPLSHSFCQHVVASGAPLMVQDAGRHPLVCDNLAIPDLGVVAYLGMPLTTPEGHVLGSLCAIDTVPRDWTTADAAALRDLAAMAVGEISMRRLAQELRGRAAQEVAEAAPPGWQERAGPLEALGQLAGGVAHDFARLLQAVRSGVQMAAAQIEENPAAARQLLGMVDGVAQRGASVTDLLLSFTRQGALGLQRVRPAALFQELAEALAPPPGGPLQVVIEAPPDLPALLTDRGELEAVLAHLAGNARDAMPGGGTLTFSATPDEVAPGADHPASLRPGRYLRLGVADTGAGMDADTLARAMEPFFTTKDGCTGLGLSMARDYAEGAGGALSIASGAGQGTRVTLWLPWAGRQGGRPV